MRRFRATEFAATAAGISLFIGLFYSLAGTDPEVAQFSTLSFLVWSATAVICWAVERTRS